MKKSENRRQPQQTKQTGVKNPRLLIGFSLAVLVVAAAGLIFLSQGASSTNSSANKGSGSSTASSDTGSYPREVSVSEAAAKRDAGALIVDVREASEWTEYHIPGAILIPLGTLADHLNDLPRDKEIIVVCRSGSRSAKGRDILRSAGFQQVTSLTGGVSMWKAQGYPVASG
jgi:rhodanese-related sulfurtransferase